MSETFLVDEVDNLSGSASVELRDPTSRNLNKNEVVTDQVALPILEAIEQPHPTDRLPPERVSGSIGDPQLAMEALKTVLAYEKKGIGQLRSTEEETNLRLKLIDDFLDLSSELTTLKDKEKYELSEKVQTMLKELKEKGCDLLHGDPSKITKEDLLELKSKISAQIDKERTKVQQIFTKMQMIIQNMISVNDIGKRMNNEFSQFLRAIIQNMVKR